MAHRAYNGWEQYRLSGKVKIMAIQTGPGPQELTVFDTEGKIIKWYRFKHDTGFFETTALEHFVEHEADKRAQVLYKEIPDDEIVTTYTYASKDGRIVGRTGRDLFGKISEQTEYFYEGDELSTSVCKSKDWQTTEYWKSNPKYSKKVRYDSQGKAVEEYKQYEKIDGVNAGFSYKYDLRGNVLSEISREDDGSGNNYYYVYYVPISSVSASSSHKSYPVKNVNDNNPKTTWVAGASPDGIGDWVLLTLKDEAFVKSLDIAPGFDDANDKSDYFLLNNRLKRITITLSSDQTISYDFNGKDRKVQIPINAMTKTIKITINSIYPGSKWRDTCISELGVNTR